MQRILIACCLLLGVLPYIAAAQTTVQQSYTTGGVQQLHLGFKYPQLITVSTYAGSEVKITAQVSINGGEYDNRFQFNSSTENGTLTINSHIADYTSIPDMYVIVRQGKRYTFANTEAGQAALKKFQANNAGYDYKMHGVDTDIKVTVQVPEGMALQVDAKFGIVELTGNFGNVKVNAIHGGVDVALAASQGHDITARTKFGEIYTNLELPYKPDGQPKNPGQWEVITSRLNGGGRSLQLESKFGNLYLRRQQ